MTGLIRLASRTVRRSRGDVRRGIGGCPCLHASDSARRMGATWKNPRMTMDQAEEMALALQHCQKF